MKILVLEDSADNLELMKEVLEMFGHEVETMSIMQTPKTQPDIAFLDLSLGDVSPLISTLGKEKIFLLSGSADIREVAESHDLAGYISKPFDLDELEETLINYSKQRGIK